MTTRYSPCQDEIKQISKRKEKIYPECPLEQIGVCENKSVFAERKTTGNGEKNIPLISEKHTVRKVFVARTPKMIPLIIFL